MSSIVDFRLPRQGLTKILVVNSRRHRQRLRFYFYELFHSWAIAAAVKGTYGDARQQIRVFVTSPRVISCCVWLARLFT